MACVSHILPLSLPKLLTPVGCASSLPPVCVSMPDVVIDPIVSIWCQQHRASSEEFGRTPRAATPWLWTAWKLFPQLHCKTFHLIPSLLSFCFSVLPQVSQPFPWKFQAMVPVLSQPGWVWCCGPVAHKKQTSKASLCRLPL